MTKHLLVLFFCLFLVMIGFGTGFSLSGVLADLTGTVIADPVEVS